MMQDFEYEDYARQFEETCKRLAPKLTLRVWRWEEVTRRLPKPGSLAAQGQVTYPNYLILELQMKVDDERFLEMSEVNTMQWVLMPERRDEIARGHIRFLLYKVERQLVD